MTKKEVASTADLTPLQEEQLKLLGQLKKKQEEYDQRLQDVDAYKEKVLAYEQQLRQKDQYLQQQYAKLKEQTPAKPVIKVKAVVKEPEKKEEPPKPVPESPKAAEKKKKLPKNWWVYLLLLAAIVGAVLCFVMDHEKDPSTIPEEDRVYLTEGQLPSLYSDTDSQKGKFVMLTGKVYSTESVEDGIRFLIYENPESCSGNTIIYCSDTSLYINENDYVTIDGYIAGTESYKNLSGGKISAPKIVALKVEKSNYQDVVSPSIKTIQPYLTIENGPGKLTMTKVEYSQNETRVYYTFENHSTTQSYHISAPYAKLLQDGVQHDNKHVAAENGYKALASEVMPNATVDGVVVYDGIDQNDPFSISVEGFCQEIQDNEGKVTFDFNVTP